MKGKHLVALKFTSLKNLGQLFEWAMAEGFEPYFSAKANINADVVVGRLMDVTQTPAMQLQATEPPDCPIHHKPLKASQYGGYYCPRKIGTQFCPVKIDEKGNWTGKP